MGVSENRFIVDEKAGTRHNNHFTTDEQDVQSAFVLRKDNPTIRRIRAQNNKQNEKANHYLICY